MKKPRHCWQGFNATAATVAEHIQNQTVLYGHRDYTFSPGECKPCSPAT